MSQQTSITEAYESLPQIAKILLQIIIGAIIGGIYRIVRYVEKKNTTTLVAGILALVPGICFIFWIIDIVTEATSNRITVLAD